MATRSSVGAGGETDGAVPRGTILVVEDERDLLSTLEYILQREGFATLVASTARDARRRLEEGPPPDLVILDVMLPDRPGTEVCRWMRSSERTRLVPVLMLTARGEEADRVAGFEVGADDYVVKPFSVRELLLRIHAILRRVRPARDESGVLRLGLLTIDEPAHRAWVGGAEVALTALEFRLLVTLFRRRGRVQTRDRLLSDVWGYRADVTSRTVDTHIKRLREKLGDAGNYVETVRGVGYRFRDGPDGADP